MSNSVTLWTVAPQTLLSIGFPRQASWSGLPFPPPGDLPDPRSEPASPVSPALQADSLPTEPSGKPNGCMSFFFFSSLFAHILVGLGEEAEVYTHVHSICCLIGSPQNPQFSNPVLLMSASSCKLVLISKWKASRNVTWFTELEDPLSKNAFGPCG